MKNAVIYARVSSKAQVEGGGLGRQIGNCTAWADKHDYEVVKCYCEAYTGTESERPALEQMFNDINVLHPEPPSVSAILVERMDRLGRDFMVGMQLISRAIETGVAVIECENGTDLTESMKTATGRAIVRMLAVMAALSKDVLVENMAAGRKKCRAENGKCEGAKEYGGDGASYSERALLVRMTKWRRAGCSYSYIAGKANELGHVTRSGGRWTRQNVAGILKRHEGKT